MSYTTTQQDSAKAKTRKQWQEPRIVLERSLEVSAQDGGPEFGPFGPLTTT